MSAKPSKKPLRVVELFAGVGGFHLGLAGKPKRPTGNYKVVWFNQWEPGTKGQHAHAVYTAKFPDVHSDGDLSNTDIAEVVRLAKQGKFTIPNHDVLVGGFPCQDYSVARTLSQSAGISGKKGVLWWSIRDILEIKMSEGKPVPYVFLENVDRLLKSPSTQRGRDFAIMLASLSDLGYCVEWRVINAADYGMPQRRRRVFILGYHSSTKLAKTMRKSTPAHYLEKTGVIASAFPVLPIHPADVREKHITGEYHEITKLFNADTPRISPFENAGIMIDRTIHTVRTSPKYKGTPSVLADFIETDERKVPQEYFINPESMPRWVYLKGAKDELRGKGTDREFIYKEGPVIFPDPLTRPSRTIVTGEGGASPSRFKHVIQTKSGRYRRLMPVELERLCMFPDNHTYIEGMTDIKRAFFMGNALVVGVIERIGKSLYTLR